MHSLISQETESETVKSRKRDADRTCRELPSRQRRGNEEGRGGREGTMAGLRWQIAVLWKFFAVESMPNALNNIPQPSSRGLV